MCVILSTKHECWDEATLFSDTKKANKVNNLCWYENKEILQLDWKEKLLTRSPFLYVLPQLDLCLTAFFNCFLSVFFLNSVRLLMNICFFWLCDWNPSSNYRFFSFFLYFATELHLFQFWSQKSKTFLFFSLVEQLNPKCIFSLKKTSFFFVQLTSWTHLPCKVSFFYFFAQKVLFRIQKKSSLKEQALWQFWDGLP